MLGAVAKGILALALLLVIASGLAACGGSGSADTGASELAHQQELAEARRQGAQDARQATQIEALERELHAVKRHAASAGQANPRPQEAPADEQPATESSSGDWPRGSGFTAILASLSSEAEASEVEAEATGRGLDAGILYSSDYSSLRPGYWVVFSGDFPDDRGAEARASHAQELGYPDAYPRFVAP
ncbi:MAG: SPOR domain-containing protein [Actinobacteria bacterium]|nr:SPOR domain-containing protein [Actinomycetota bacterium]